MTPDTTDFMIAGYAVIFSLLFIYLGSLIVRWRSLKREQHILEEIDKK